MAIPTILQGDSSGGVAITLAEGHNYEGATLVVVFNGVTREFTNLTAGGEVSLAFTADETANMPLGAGLVLMRLIGPTGAVETVGNADARIKVTDCVAEVNAGGSFAVTPRGNPLDGVEGLGMRCTGDQLRAKINEVIVKLGGTVAALLVCALPCLGGVTVQTAPLGGIYSDEPVVTNVIVDLSDKADAANVYTKAETDAKIVELAPTPDLSPYLRKDLPDNQSQIFGGYLSGFGFHADLGYNGNGWLQYTAHNGNLLTQSLPDYIASNPWGFLTTLAKATNYTDVALAAFASTGAVARATVYGTPTRWTDATGCVWEGFTGWTFSDGKNHVVYKVYDPEYSPDRPWGLYIDTTDLGPGISWYETESDRDAVMSFTDDRFDPPITATYATTTNYVGKLALTNDLPDVSGYATPADVTAAIREHSLSGIWDSKLGVWWTPHMANGALRYIAATNVNLNAEN